MCIFKKGLSLFLVAILLCSCHCDEARRIHNISAFAHTYGLVRWFHPSEEATKIDWNKFALYGIKEVADCRNKKELQKKLEELFLPIAPTISFFNKQADFSNNNLELLLPTDEDPLFPIFWQHSGVDLGIRSNYYISKRANRSLVTENISKLALLGYFPSDMYKGHKIRMSAKIKIDSISSDIGLHMMLLNTSVDNHVKLCAIDTSAILLNDASWCNYEREISIDDSLGNIYWGIYPERGGSFSIESIALYDLTTNSPINEFSFHSSREKDSREQSNEAFYRTNQILYDYKENKDCIEISTKNLLFEETPKVDTIIIRKINTSLYVGIPLVLYGDSTRTYPEGDPILLERLKRRIEGEENEERKLANIYKEYADIIVTWNVIKYFSPYLHEMSLGWDKELVIALRQLKSYSSDNYNIVPLQLMMAKLEDAHVYSYSESDYPSYYTLPFRVKKVEDKIVVVSSGDSLINRGDIVRKINKESTYKKYSDYENRISAFSHRKNYIVSNSFHLEYKNSAPLEISIDRNGRNIVVNSKTIFPSLLYHNESLSEPNKPDVQIIDKDIIYTNIANIRFDQISAILESRNDNQTVIFDLREGEPRFFLFRYILPLLTDTSLPELRNTQLLPKTIYPQTPVLPDTTTNISVMKPNLKNIFLINNSCISNIENYLDIIRFAGLGYFIGSNTAGCNGQVNSIPLPSGGIVQFTGAKYVSVMGPEHYYYRTGIKPDFFIEETINDIRQDSDIILERAVEIIKFGVSVKEEER